MKLVMSLLVRNESDVVRDNITFHLAHGVDHVVATDNGSDDGTRDILAEFERMGVATIIDEPAQICAQATWVTRMALLARDELQADWILNNDADEFWVAPSGNLKAGLNRTEADSLNCRRRNMVFACDGEPSSSSWHERIVHRTVTPVKLPRLADRLNDPLPCPYFYLALPPKVMVRAAGLVSVGGGNHKAVHVRGGKPQRGDVDIYHFPVRSARQFHQKVMQGGSAVARNPDLSKNTSWHWRRWHKKFMEGHGDDALRDALPTADRLRADIEEGCVVLDETMKNLLAEYPSSKQASAARPGAAKR